MRRGNSKGIHATGPKPHQPSHTTTAASAAVCVSESRSVKQRTDSNPTLDGILTTDCLLLTLDDLFKEEIGVRLCAKRKEERDGVRDGECW